MSNEIELQRYEKERLDWVISESRNIHEMMRRDFIGQCSSREHLDKIQGTFMTLFDMLRDTALACSHVLDILMTERSDK